MTKIPYITGFNAYLKTRHISERSHDEYLNSLHDFFDYLVEHNANFQIDQDVAKVHDVDILEYKHLLDQEQKLSPATINKILSNLNIYFKYLFTNRLTKDLPTLNVNSLSVPTQSDFPTDVFLNEQKYLNDINLKIYTRLLILVTSKGFNYQDALKDGFYRQFNTLSFNDFEKTFLDEYHDFIAPLRQYWQNDNLFLSRNKAAKSAILTIPALYRDLKNDSQKTNLDLSAKKLYTTYILLLLSCDTPDQAQLEQIRQMEPASLLYYRRLLRESDFQV